MLIRFFSAGIRLLPSFEPILGPTPPPPPHPYPHPRGFFLLLPWCAAAGAGREPPFSDQLSARSFSTSARALALPMVASNPILQGRSNRPPTVSLARSTGASCSLRHRRTSAAALARLPLACRSRAAGAPRRAPVVLCAGRARPGPGRTPRGSAPRGCGRSGERAAAPHPPAQPPAAVGRRSLAVRHLAGRHPAPRTKKPACGCCGMQAHAPACARAAHALPSAEGQAPLLTLASSLQWGRSARSAWSNR